MNSSDDFGALIAVITFILFLLFIGGAIDNLWIKDKPQIIITYTFPESDCQETNVTGIYLCEVKSK